MSDELLSMSAPSSSPSLRRSLRHLDRLLSRLSSSPRPVWSSADDSLSFLDSFDSLLSLISSNPFADKPLLDAADDLLQRAAFRLRDEFRELLVAGSRPAVPAFSDDDNDDDTDIPTAPPVTDFNLVVDALPAGTVADLRDVARRLAAAGFDTELAQTYCISRREFLEESLSRLGHRPVSPETVNSTPWPELEEEIRHWVVVVHVAAKILFPSERRLAERVFAGLGHVTETSLAELCRGPAAELLAFADAIAVTGKAPEKLFRMLDLYAAVRDLLPDFEFCSPVLRLEAAATQTRLAAAVRGIFTVLENLIRRDPAGTALPGAGPHPITRYVMNYLRTACESRRELEEVMEDEDGGGLAVRVAWTMDVLQENLEGKAAVYSAAGASFFFLANNGWYAVKRLRESELRELLGEDWLRRQTMRVRQWRNGFAKASWGKAGEVLRDGGGGGGARVRGFNEWFEERLREQRGWVAVDEQLRTELTRAAAEAVVPAYRRFLEKVAAEEPGREWEKMVRFSPERVEACIGELFQETRAPPR